MLKTVPYIAMAVVFASASAVAHGQAAPPSSPAVTLAPGDILHIEVWRQPMFSGDFTIAPDSTISHPLYRELRVAGLPLTEVEARLKAFLSRYEVEPAFVVLPRIRVVVAGEVRNPSVLIVPAGTTLLEALAGAGGPTDRAKLENVQLLRDTGTQEFDIADPTVTRTRVPLRSGDQIVVPRYVSFFRDYLSPVSSVVGALAAIVSIAVTLRK